MEVVFVVFCFVEGIVDFGFDFWVFVVEGDV